ncbi:hypothetical protein [Pseudochryseolinea flava]|uniref:Uncharacterized protein n=1 Tax=Pseudochryseolinea flava TaxID=2059302 RepID=A0A364Y7E0_9BACT|nr:hypothetical protein [Pseudochryseolinea flava]RAW02054.1 hypothetical protein DQQ10_05740 [Pseudochryseolinea flava]
MYEVTENQKFELQFYPEVQRELIIISNHLKQMMGDHKAEIVISFLKGIRAEWFKENDDVIKLITSRFLRTEHIEELFKGCKTNRIFINDFERCILTSLV